jgi:hypothetical protein
VLECTVDGIDVLLRFMVDGPEFRVEGENCVVLLGREGLGFAILGGDLV